ncbi:hypothetical protein HDF26_001612 [Pedobacter cryoconitis]|uniref:hypothetical protein n=1 Tax=Pedobacter cryoconitis TaxID=188932 RepID=UPI001620AD83|nr:hypothetical protein [Pedobacter cryoconitis]MBB6271185.1 hypothetical protein [Pedobacter cryoconitis]
MNEISLLLGAGFSVNKGFPTANKLNNKITSLTKNDFCVAQQGSFCWLEKGQNDPFPQGEYYKCKMFTLELIAYYAKNHDFNYEEFYDYYTNVNNPDHNDKGFEELCNNFREKYKIKLDNVNLISRHNSIFNQLISALLVDGEGRKFYDAVHHTGDYDGYVGFLRCLKEWGEGNVVHINTLNHDLFFESLNYTDEINGELSDGFSETGSIYYGELENDEKIKLSCFSGKYETKYRLYKLHGSLDQYPFHLMDGGEIENYIKIKWGVGVTDLYKESLDEKGEVTYVRDFINYFPDFLSGTTSKITRYRDPIYYKNVFNTFESTLSASKVLVLIGYGCGDSEINNIIFKNFTGKVYVVDPYPQPKTYEFCDKTNAVLIQKTPNDILLTDFQ